MIHRGKRPNWWRHRPAVLLVVLAFGLLLVAQDGHAGSGLVHTVPGLSIKPRTGLRLTVDTNWVEGPGYCPVRVRLTAAAASVADRTVTVRFFTGTPLSHSDYHIRAERDIDLPAGRTTVDTMVAVPRYAPWGAIWWNVWVDGRYAEDLSVDRIGMAWTGNSASHSRPTVLVVGPTLQSLRALSRFVGFVGEGQAVQVGTPVAGTSGTLGGGSVPLPGPFALVAPADLPTRWIDFSCLDIVCLSTEQLAAVVRRQAPAWQAIVEWVAAGGNLWVYGVGGQWERVGEVEQALGFPAGPAPASSSSAERGWRLPTGEEPTDIAFPDGRPRRTLLRQQGAAESPKSRQKRRTGPPQFAWRDLGLGCVAVMQAPEPFLDDDDTWQWMFGSIGPNRLLWNLRHGLSPDVPSDDFWDFLIPGVGLAPVTVFYVLITLFVVLIGPLNYLLLRHRNRLQFLVITVPLGAAVVTGSLFAYALIADGLAIRVRARSLTCIDQRRGLATCWARLSYYAGLAPARGLTFPPDTVVLPLLAAGDGFSQRDAGQRFTRRDIEWNGDQRLARGWLDARTPTQYLTLRSYRTDRTLQVRADTGPVEVENRLGTNLRHLLLVDSTGRFHWGADIGPGCRTTLAPIPKLGALKQLRSVLAAVAPQLPPGIPRTQGGRNPGTMRPVRIGNASMYSSRLERVLSSLARPLAPGNDDPWQMRTYVAVTEPAADVGVGIENVAEEASLHIILGAW